MGFGENVLPTSDDGASGFIDITSIFPNGINFFGTIYTGFYINNNGSISFGQAMATYTPEVIAGNSGVPVIAPFWADVDTRTTNSIDPDPGGNSRGTNRVYFDFDPTTGTITITWDDVGFYSGGDHRNNAFQLQIIRVNETDFDIVFRYENIEWTTGSASDGVDGLGGTPARAGYSAGDGTNFFELPASGDQGALLNLEYSSNVQQPGSLGIPGPQWRC